MERDDVAQKGKGLSPIGVADSNVEAGSPAEQDFRFTSTSKRES